MALNEGEISEIAREAAKKVLESQGTCVSAGMTLARDQQSFRKATPIIFRVNVQGLVSEDDLKIPHSELAMHVGAAGKDLIAFALTGTQTGMATYDGGEGRCGFIFGREDELFKPALADKVKEMWEKRGPDNPGSNPSNPMGEGEGPKLLYCKECGKEYATWRGLEGHFISTGHKGIGSILVKEELLAKMHPEFNSITKESIPGEYITIVDPGKTTFKEGEIISLEAFEKENERVKKLGEKPATGK